MSSSICLLQYSVRVLFWISVILWNTLLIVCSWCVAEQVVTMITRTMDTSGVRRIRKWLLQSTREYQGRLTLCGKAHTTLLLVIAQSGLLPLGENCALAANQSVDCRTIILLTNSLDFFAKVWNTGFNWHVFGVGIHKKSNDGRNGQSRPFRGGLSNLEGASNPILWHVFEREHDWEKLGPWKGGHHCTEWNTATT